MIKLAKCRPGLSQSQPNFKFLQSQNIYNKSANVQQTQQLFCTEQWSSVEPMLQSFLWDRAELSQKIFHLSSAASDCTDPSLLCFSKSAILM